MIAIIREQQDADQDADKLREAGIPAIGVGVLTCHSNMPALTRSGRDCQAIIFTSMRAISKDYLELDVPVWCVGKATAQQARDFGYDVVEVETNNAKELADALAGAITPDAGALLWVSGRHTAFDLVSYLARDNIKVVKQIVYEMVPTEYLSGDFVDMVKAGKITAITVLSKRMLNSFMYLMDAEDLWGYHKDWTVFTFSKGTITKEQSLAFSAHIICDSSNFEDLLQTIKNWYSKSQD